MGLIMNLLRAAGRLTAGADSFPVFLTVTDISNSAGRNTNVPRAAEFIRSKGVRTLFKSRAILVIFHIFAQIMYDANIREQEAWQPGQYSLATLKEMFFSDPHFGNHRANLLASVEAGCDYCFWMIHFRNRQLIHDVPISTETSSHLPTSLDTNLVCMFADSSSQC